MKELVINVDCDGVLSDFHGDFRRMVEAELGREMPPASTWSWWEEWDWSESQWLSWFRHGVMTGQLWANGEMVPGASDTLWRLSDDGHYIRIVTHRLAFNGLHNTAIRNTVAWLQDKHIPYRAISFEGRKQDIDADVVIDDKPDLSWAQPFKLNILFDQPYNRDVHLDAKIRRGIRVVRASDWNQIPELIDGVYGEIEEVK